MRTLSLQRLSFFLLALSVCGLSACKTVSEEEASSPTLDPHSSGSRARLDAAQKAFSGSGAIITEGSDSDLAMKGFNPGGGDLSMGGFNTKDLDLKGFDHPGDYNGAKTFAGADKSFGSKMSPLGGMTSNFSNQALAGESGKTFSGRSYGTKAYQPRTGGLRLPGFMKPKIISVESLVDKTAGPTPEAVSVGDIRKLLNR